MKCPDCGNENLLEQTVFNRAMCRIQVHIDRDLFCYDCCSEEQKDILDNPNKTCDGCKFISKTCLKGWSEGVDHSTGSGGSKDKTEWGCDYVGAGSGYSSEHKPKIDRGPFNY